MKRFAVAFATTGNSPKDGHRFSEIVVVGDENGVAYGEAVSFKLVGDEAKDSVEFATALDAMKSLVGDSAIVVHDAGKWRRFLRAELRTIKRHGAANLMNNVVDVSAWAHQRYPRQRKDVAAIARRAGVEIPVGLVGMALEAELLRRISNVMAGSAVAADVLPATTTLAISVRQGWVERIRSFWRSLTGGY